MNRATKRVTVTLVVVIMVVVLMTSINQKLQKSKIFKITTKHILIARKPQN